MSIEDSFSELLGRQASHQERERLQRIKTAFKLSDNDALWSVLVALEYYDSLYREYPRRITSELRSALQELRIGPDEQASAKVSSQAPIGSLAGSILAMRCWIPALLAYQVFLGAVCLSAGSPSAHARPHFGTVATGLPAKE